MSEYDWLPACRGCGSEIPGRGELQAGSLQYE
jgi:hypothetical protein